MVEHLCDEFGDPSCTLLRLWDEKDEEEEKEEDFFGLFDISSK